jgi:hypothetical protein
MTTRIKRLPNGQPTRDPNGSVIRTKDHVCGAHCPDHIHSEDTGNESDMEPCPSGL